MADEPSRFTGPLLTAAMLIAVVGWVVRRFTAQPALAPAGAAGGAGAVDRAPGHGGLPRPSGFRQALERGHRRRRRGAALRVAGLGRPLRVPLLLLVSGIGMPAAVDLLACGMRRAPLGGLPLLLAITISASVLLATRSTGWSSCSPGFGFLALIAIQETDQRQLAGAAARRSGRPARPRSAGSPRRIAVTCGLVAVVLSSALSSDADARSAASARTAATARSTSRTRCST